MNHALSHHPNVEVRFFLAQPEAHSHAASAQDSFNLLKVTLAGCKNQLLAVARSMVSPVLKR